MYPGGGGIARARPLSGPPPYPSSCPRRAATRRPSADRHPGWWWASLVAGFEPWSRSRKDTPGSLQEAQERAGIVTFATFVRFAQNDRFVTFVTFARNQAREAQEGGIKEESGLGSPRKEEKVTESSSGSLESGLKVTESGLGSQESGLRVTKVTKVRKSSVKVVQK